MKRNLTLIIPFAFTLLSISCQTSPPAPDISAIDLPPVNIIRYEQDLFTLHPDSLQPALEKMSVKYPLFIGDQWDNPVGILQMKNYLSDPLIVEAYLQSARTFPDLKKTEADLHLAFRYLKYYFPEWLPPVVYSYISGYDVENGIFTADRALVIPLDNYLGLNHKAYQQVRIPQYIIQRMSDGYLVPDIIRTIGMELMPPFPAGESLAEQMVAIGKLLYLIQSVLPGLPPHLLIGYTADQYRWCLENEKEIWGFLISQNILFSKDKAITGKFMNEAPSTQGFPAGSPGRTGHFLGWQIVAKYMENHPDISLSDLTVNIENLKVFEQSGYKPPR
jgi:hypothetical protein